MSQTTAIAFALSLAAMICLCGLFFVLWAAWDFFWHLYDSHMQKHKRIKNKRLDAAYRTGQFYCPPTMRDYK